MRIRNSTSMDCHGDLAGCVVTGRAVAHHHDRSPLEGSGSAIKSCVKDRTFERREPRDQGKERFGVVSVGQDDKVELGCLRRGERSRQGRSANQRSNCERKGAHAAPTSKHAIPLPLIHRSKQTYRHCCVVSVSILVRTHARVLDGPLPLELGQVGRSTGGISVAKT